ncbi:YggT family protein [Sphingomonas sp. S1-29]|uniref:YggT family protein n=1 Tax=Sphingomonas sp. S1-29 TaxID=2991074 RepID=UPI00223E8FB7|nr:YggT family protein [Sphingomonas sp. S1-29]UZK68314.1 YggT family protein [Sphingomonas sp. S1-29]
MLILLEIIQMLITIARWVIIIHIVLSLLIAFNVINTSNDFVRSIWNGLDALTEPVYRPIRRVLPDFGSLDLAPMVVLIGLSIVDIIVSRLAANIATGGAVPL